MVYYYLLLFIIHCIAAINSTLSGELAWNMEATSFGLTFRCLQNGGETFPVDHSEIHWQGQRWRGIKTSTRGWGVNHMQTVLCNCFTFVLHCFLIIYRRHWVIWACRRRQLGKDVFLLIIQTPCYMSQQIFRGMPLFLWRLKLLRLRQFTQSPGIPQIRRLFFRTMPSLSRRLLGLMLFVWPLKEEFSTPCLPRRERLSSCLVL